MSRIEEAKAAPFSGNIVACPDCDLLQNVPALPFRGTARCPRCSHIIAVNKPDFLNRTLALTVAAAIVLIIANLTPLMGLSAVGRESSTTILGGVLKMWQQGQGMTAVLVAFCAVVSPVIHISFMITVLLALRRQPAPSWVGTLLRISRLSQPWSMVEVMMLGILVALIKIADLATVIPGIGMFAVGAVIVLIAAITVSFDEQEVWKHIRWVNEKVPQAAAKAQPANVEAKVITDIDSQDALTGSRLGLVLCETCDLLSRPADVNEPGYCPRCGRELTLRRPDMMQRTWALLIAAAICYIPANLMPIMSTTTPKYAEEDTIMSGIVLLYESGSWPLALIVLIASIMIPMAKIIALVYLLITIQFRSKKSPQERLRLYRLVEFVGRWSMLDVFVVTFVVALVQLQPIMSVKPNAGIMFFAAVVVLTMLAANSFDPRLIWDASNKENKND